MAQSESGLLEVVDTICRRWRLIVAVALSFLVGAALYFERQPPHYEAAAIVAVTPRTEQSSADLVRVAAPRFAAYITAEATIGRVAGRLGEDAGDLRRQVNATIVPDTGNITITVRHRDPHRAMTVANQLADQLRRASAPDRFLLVQSVAPAVLPTSPAGPPRRLAEASALVAGLILGVGLAALADALLAWPVRRPVPGRQPPPPRLPAPRSGPAPPELGRGPVVGELPCSPALRTSVAGALADPAVDAAVGALTSNLARPLGRDVRGTILVTAPGPHQGKTTVARLLAASRLRSGARVLRIDGHCGHAEIGHARKQHGNGHKHPAPGPVKSAATGPNWVQDLWVMEDGMWVLSATHGPAAVALIEGGEGGILEQARELFDCIILDAPPVLGDGGPAISRRLLPLADAVLVVTSPDSTVEALYRSIEAFREVPGPFVGVVLNRVREAGAPPGATAREEAAS